MLRNARARLVPWRELRELRCEVVRTGEILSAQRRVSGMAHAHEQID